MVLEIIAGIGGIGAVFVVAVGFASNIIAERLQKKYSLQLNKELEEYKSNLANKNYVSKVRFDKEFKMYQKLSDRRLNLVFQSSTLSRHINMRLRNEGTFSRYIKQLVKEENEFFIGEIKTLQEKYNENNFLNRMYAPFIDEQMYEKLDRLNRMCSKQINNYCEITLLIEPEKDYNIDKDILNHYPVDEIERPFSDNEEIISILKDILETQDEISKMSDNLTKDMRSYLRLLEVVD